jgi:hypothetical protein
MDRLIGRIRPEGSIGDLFKDLSSETSMLLRQELQLARTELSVQMAQMGRDVAALAIGGAIIYAGLLTIVAAIVLLLIAANVAPWLACTLVGVICFAVGGWLISTRLSAIKERRLAPRQTVASLQETAEWLKNETR